MIPHRCVFMPYGCGSRRRTSCSFAKQKDPENRLTQIIWSIAGKVIHRVGFQCRSPVFQGLPAVGNARMYKSNDTNSRLRSHFLVMFTLAKPCYQHNRMSDTRLIVLALAMKVDCRRRNAPNINRRGGNFWSECPLRACFTST